MNGRHPKKGDRHHTNKDLLTAIDEPKETDGKSHHPEHDGATKTGDPHTHDLEIGILKRHHVDENGKTIRNDRH